MSWIVQNLWLIPVLPLAAAAVSALARQSQKKLSSGLAIGSMAGSLVLSCVAMVNALHHWGHGEPERQFHNFRWFQFAENDWVSLGWVLDPLTAVMLVMVCFVGLLIFIYSTGYMAHDENFTRFFCFLSLFAAAMLGVVIANSLLLFFICWELVGLTSYLLIGFWYHKPSACAAAKKAFITTRIGDLAFLLGMVWLYSESHTLLFYEQGGIGCLESKALARMVVEITGIGMAVTTGIGILIFCGAVGKSGQVPLHVWLPDAMEGPTPVSALIHAATMVAAGVFLVARMYPLMAALPVGLTGTSSALQVVSWIGAITAVFAATIAVAQNDIKRILAYSTVSQLGFMMLGLGVGGVAVGMFHLITHAFFKALLFMGAGSVIHGCREEQDIRCMGGLRKYMPVTFATYAVGMMALSGVPVLFSGFWSKDEILHAAHGWSISRWPFYMAVFAAFLTAFYMTRQMLYVFFGTCRIKLGSTTGSEQRTVDHGGKPASEHPHGELSTEPHESPGVMILPLIVLSVFAVLLGFLGTPAAPWFQSFLEGEKTKIEFSALMKPDVLFTMGVSILVVVAGIGLGWRLYGRKEFGSVNAPDALEGMQPEIHTLLRNKYFVDEVYEWCFVGLNSWWGRACDWLDRTVLSGAVYLLSLLVVGLSWVDKTFDEQVVNRTFDQGCEGVNLGGGFMSRLHDGRVQNYLRVLGVAMAVLVLILIWGCHSS